MVEEELLEDIVDRVRDRLIEGQPIETSELKMMAVILGISIDKKNLKK